MFAMLLCICMVSYKILKNKEKIKKLSVKQIVAIGVLYAFMFTIAFCMIYPALTVSNLSVPKAKRQVQDAHHKFKDVNELTRWAVN